MAYYYGDDDDLGTREQADHDTAALTRAGNIVSRMAKKGICSHGWIGPAVPGVLHGEFKCNHCGKVFPSQEAAMQAHDDFMQEYT